MIKLSIIVSIIILKLSASTLQNFNANFKQTITDEYNKTIKYSGIITAQSPSNVMYNYTSPMKKSVYLLGKKVIIIEDELEQVIVRKLKSEINLFEVLKNAKKNRDEIYTSKYRGFEFKIKKEKDVPKYIEYSDELDNTIQIEFFNIQKNNTLQKSLFQPSFPAYYDVIKE